MAILKSKIPSINVLASLGLATPLVKENNWAY